MMSDQSNSQCPYCDGQTEKGCLLGNVNFPYVQDGLQWFEGEPTAMKNLMMLGEPVGKRELLRGSYITGIRCTKCKKIILDY